MAGSLSDATGHRVVRRGDSNRQQQREKRQGYRYRDEPACYRSSGWDELFIAGYKHLELTLVGD